MVHSQWRNKREWNREIGGETRHGWTHNIGNTPEFHINSYENKFDGHQCQAQRTLETSAFVWGHALHRQCLRIKLWYIKQNVKERSFPFQLKIESFSFFLRNGADDSIRSEETSRLLPPGRKKFFNHQQLNSGICKEFRITLILRFPESL